MKNASAKHLSYFPLKYYLDHNEFLFLKCQDGKEICCGKTTKLMDAIDTLCYVWKDTGGHEKVNIPCVCGGLKSGAAAFGIGHSSWCYRALTRI